MKNIKPAYATKLGTGVFVGSLFGLLGKLAETPLYKCRACGKVYDRCKSSLEFPPRSGCPNTASGDHIWVKI